MIWLLPTKNTKVIKMIKVSVRKERRLIDDFDTDLTFKVGELKEIGDRVLKANSIKVLLFNGDLIVEEGGEVELNIKGNTVKISSEDKNNAYFSENGKDYVKNLVTGEIKEVE